MGEMEALLFYSSLQSEMRIEDIAAYSPSQDSCCCWIPA